MELANKKKKQKMACASAGKNVCDMSRNYALFKIYCILNHTASCLRNLKLLISRKKRLLSVRDVGVGLSLYCCKANNTF